MVGLHNWFTAFGGPDQWIDSWLGKLDNGTWSKGDQDTFDLLYGYGFQGVLDYKLNKRSRQQYQENTGLGYGDTNDPRKWPGAGNYGQQLRMVSDNIKRLFK